MKREHFPTTGSLVWHLATRWRAVVDREVAPFGLTHAQYSALASLRSMTSGGATPTQRELAEFTGLGPIYVSKLVRTLEQNDFVTRTPHPTDARAVQLTLTPHGTEVIDRAVPVVRALDRRLTAPLGGPGSPAIQALTESLTTLLEATGQGDTA